MARRSTDLKSPLAPQQSGCMEIVARAPGDPAELKKGIVGQTDPVAPLAAQRARFPVRLAA